jgi:small subunit ribosomal protein S17
MAMAKKDTIRGRVVSDKMDKTVVVAVDTVRRHPLYKKAVRRVKKYMAHDEANAFHVGDWVDIIETRPLSGRKRWCVVSDIVQDVAEALPEQEGEQ